MKLNTIISSQDALLKLSNTKLPVKIAYSVSKMISKLQPELKIYEEARQKLVKELGEEDTEKQTTTVKPENFAKFQEEMTKLLDVEVDLSYGLGKEIEKIKVADLGDITMEPKELLQLDWLLE